MPAARSPARRARSPPPPPSRGRAERRQPPRRAARVSRAVRAARGTAPDRPLDLMSGASARADPRGWVATSALPLPLVAITAITGLAAVLRFDGLGQVALNPFYDAAVRS